MERPSALASVDRIAESRYDAAVQLVEKMRARTRTGTPDEVVDQIVRRYSRELGTVAALSGGAAALPGTGTAAAVLATGADVAYTVGKLGEMVLAIGLALGHDAGSLEERRAWILAVLSMGRGAATGVDGLAGRIGAEGGARIVSSISQTQLDTVNSRLAAKFLARLASEQTAARLGRVLPFGIGAGVGAAGNVVIVRSVARSARRFFGAPAGSVPPGSVRPGSVRPGSAPPEAPPPRPGGPTVRIDADVIDVEVIEER